MTEESDLLAVMHDGGVVIGSSQVVGLHLGKVSKGFCEWTDNHSGVVASVGPWRGSGGDPQLTWPNVLGEDVDVGVPVRAGLFVVEAQGVENLVLHRAGVQATSSPQGDRLSSALATDVGPAPGTHTHTHKASEWALAVRRSS